MRLSMHSESHLERWIQVRKRLAQSRSHGFEKTRQKPFPHRSKDLR